MAFCRCLSIAAMIGIVLGCCGCGREGASPKGNGEIVADAQAVPSIQKERYSDLIPFVDVTSASNAVFTFRNGSEHGHCTILESLGGGVAAFDFDGDSVPDLCFAGGGSISQDKKIDGLPLGLFRNLQDWKFKDVSASARLSDASLYTHGVAAADYNNDGFCDLLVTGFGGVQLWMNQGDGTFRNEIDASELNDTSWSTSAAWADLNGDGVLDLYVAHYVDWSFENHPFCPGPQPGERDICPPKTYSPLPDAAYLGNGDGTFREIGEGQIRGDGKGLGVLAADVDNDGDMDIYVANDTTDNFLYLNDGQGGLSEMGILSGTATGARGTPDGSMGVDLCDFNRDGRFDVCVANYERETFALYRNEGSGQFLHVSQAAGLTALDGLSVGFGTACADFDHDADEDIVVANGHVILFPIFSPRRQLPLFLVNEGKRFSRARTDAGYFAEAHEGRGLVVADLDGDGDLDSAISHMNDPVALLRNDRKTGQSIVVQLIGRESNRDAIGARIQLQTSDRDLYRQIKGGGSYLSTHDKRVFFGFPDDVSANALTITWPSGRQQTVASPEANSHLVLLEPID